MNITKGLLPNVNNYRKGRNGSVAKYIVIHYTANKGDTALNNVKYFANNVVKASAHFFVDENSVHSSVPVNDTAWHCGGGLQGKGGHNWFGICTNSNSIGIEMCLWDKQGNVRQGTISMCIELVKYLMKTFNIPTENVIRHWDVTGKECPKPMIGDNNSLWLSFKKQLVIDNEEDIVMKQKIQELEQKISNLEERIATLESKSPMIYNYIDNNMSDEARAIVKKLCDAGALRGNEKGELGLSEDMLRLIIILHRNGALK